MMRLIFRLSMLVVFIFSFFACGEGFFVPPGSARFIVDIDGYDSAEKTGVSVTLGLQGEEFYVSKFVSTKNGHRADLLFSGLEAGTWRGEVAFVDGDSLVGSYVLSITVDSGAAVTVGIAGEYQASAGTTNFSHTVSVDGTSAITFSDVNAVLVEERRMWDNSADDPAVWTEIVAEGNFSSALRGNAAFPDGLAINISSAKSSSYHTYGVSDTQAWAIHSPYDASLGTYTLDLADISGAGSGISYVTDVDLSGVSVPDITFPDEGATISGQIIINWTLSSSAGVANIYIFILEEGSIFESVKLANSATTYTSAVTNFGKEYEVLVLTADNPIDPLLGPVIDANAGSYFDVINLIMRDYSADIDYIGAARLHVTGG